MASFEDHFSEQAREYASFRPQYPGELFTYLAFIAPNHQLAWDCGTGNGQAAWGLAKHFDRVIATDASPDQIAQAVAHERIEYRAVRAEEVSLTPQSVALISVATAVHWFDLEPFYEVVQRAASQGGIIAVWTYHLPVIEPAIDHLLKSYYSQVLAGYWPERFHYVDNLYRTLPFPFEELDPPKFEMQAFWNLDQLAGFLDSWSATRRYQNQQGQHPVKFIWPELSEAWGDHDNRRTIRWPLYLRVGRVK